MTGERIGLVRVSYIFDKDCFVNYIIVDEATCIMRSTNEYTLLIFL